MGLLRTTRAESGRIGRVSRSCCKNANAASASSSGWNGHPQLQRRNVAVLAERRHSRRGKKRLPCSGVKAFRPQIRVSFGLQAVAVKLRSSEQRKMDYGVSAASSFITVTLLPVNWGNRH